MPAATTTPFGALRVLIQHDVNCLGQGGADRSRRRQAITQLRDKLSEAQVLDRRPDEDDDERDVLVVDVLVEPLVCTLNDQAESCRSAALDLMKRVIPTKTHNLIFFFGMFLEAVADRLISGREPCEEVRLASIQLMTELIPRVEVGAIADRFGDQLVKIARKTLTDPFPDLKENTCFMVDRLASRSSSIDFRPVIPALLSNAKHQRHRVRLETIRSISAILQAAGEDAAGHRLPSWFTRDVLPILSDAPFDRSPLICSAAFDQVALILSQFDVPKGDHLSSLLLTVISTMADETDQLQLDARQRFDSMILFSPGGSEPSRSSRDLLVDNLSPLLSSQVLPMLSGWTPTLRQRASRALLTIIGVVQAQISSHLDRIVPALVQAMNDDEDRDNTPRLCGCATMIGRHGDPEATLQVLYADLAQAVGHLNQSRTAAALVVGRHVLQGLHLGMVSTGVADFLGAIFALDLTATPSEALLFMKACSDVAPESCRVFEGDVVAALLTASTVNRALGVEVAAAIATSLALESPGHLYIQHFRSILSRLRSSRSSIQINASLLLCLVDQTAPLMTYDHTREAVSFLTTYFSSFDQRADEPTDNGSHLPHIVTLLDILEMIMLFAIDIETFMDLIVTEILSRCLIWRVGKDAAGMRLRALSCIVAVSRRRPGIYSSCSPASLDQLLAHIVSSLDDFDLEIRLLSISCLRLFLQDRKLSLNVPSTLRGELLARLDDNNDQVRIDTCSALVDLCSRDSNDKEETLASDIVSLATIHLDDPNPAVQSAVFSLFSFLGVGDTSCKQASAIG